MEHTQINSEDDDVETIQYTLRSREAKKLVEEANKIVSEHVLRRQRRKSGKTTKVEDGHIVDRGRRRGRRQRSMG